MAGESKSNGVPWATVISLISAVLVAFISFYGNYRINQLQNQLDQQRLDNEILLAQSRFEEEQRARRDTILSNWVPLLVSDDAAERNRALAVLFAIYPDDVYTILTTVSESQGQGVAANSDLQAALASAESLSELVGEWVVIVTTLPTLPEAQASALEAEALGYVVAIYQFAPDSFSVAIGPFPARDDANRANIAVRAQLNQGAYTLNITQECPQPQPQEGYVACGE